MDKHVKVTCSNLKDSSVAGVSWLKPMVFFSELECRGYNYALDKLRLQIYSIHVLRKGKKVADLHENFISLLL